MIDLFFAFQDDHLFTQVLYIEIELKKKASHNEITEAIPDTKVVERGKGNGIFAIPQNSHRNFRRQAYVTIPSSYLSVFVLPEKADISLKPIPVITCVSFAVLRIFINTTGIGFVLPDVDVYAGNAQPGDSVIVSGTIGNHGIEVLSSR